jgi:hypothetical protein
MVTRGIVLNSASDGPTVVRALDSQMHEVWSGVVDQATSVSLPAGLVALKATFSDGRESHQVIDTTVLDQVTLKAPAAAAATFTDMFYASKIDGLDTMTGARHRLRSVRAAPTPQVRIAVWIFENDSWHVGPLSNVSGPAKRARFVHVMMGATRALGVSTALPSVGKLVCDSSGLAHVEGTNRDAEVLMQMLATGDMRAASVYFAGRTGETVGDTSAMETPGTDSARRLLHAKFNDPFGAAVGAFVLLRSERFADVPDWFERLATSFPLPDGAVARARQILQTGGDLQHARAHLLEAARRGVPLLTEAFRILLDDLALFRRRQDGSEDAEVVDAVQRLRTYSDHVLWALPLTTFSGSPMAPGQPYDARGEAYVVLGPHAANTTFNLQDY